jgi:hypothetical protein
LPRAVSEYLHQAVKSKSYPSFESLISSEVAAIRKCRKNNGIHLDQGFDNGLFKCLSKSRLKKFLLSTAFYSYFVNAWLQKFPKEQHYFLDYEVFRSDPQNAVNGISAFLGLSLPPILNYTWIYNKANTREGIAAKLRSSIRVSSSLTKEISRQISPFVMKMYEIIEQDYEWNLNSLV